MFGNWMALGGRVENEDRSPPPPATPLDFPQYEPADHIQPYTEETARDLYYHFATIQKPADVTSKHLDALNLRVLRDQTLDDIIPCHPSDRTLFLPDLYWERDPGNIDDPLARSITPKYLCNGREAPKPEVYRLRKAELTADNDDVFRAVQRLPPLPGKQPLKPGYFFKFWQGLFLMSQYWDTTLDHEYDDNQGPSSHTAGTNESIQPARRYNGRRTGTGKDMPDQFREDTVRALVDTVTWLFGCQVSVPRMPPRLTMRSSFFAVRLSFSVFRTPLDRQRARQGLVEGPVMGVQTRPETSFRLPEEQVGKGRGEALDLLREVAALLLLAQERAREGKSEKKPGEGKWYTSTPRWGGGPGGEVGNAAGNSDEETSKKEDKKFGRTRSRRTSAAEAYKTLHPGMGTWDPKTTYLAIGKREESEVDDVFLISSINHHVSILRLSVHPSYISFLESGKPPTHSTSSEPSHSQAPWFALELRRSKWYDLFSTEDRVEAMRGIWGVMAWLMRDKSKGETAGGTAEEDTVMSD